MLEKRLSEELELKLKTYIAENQKSVSDFDYTICDDGERIILSGKSYGMDSSYMICVNCVEEMLDASFENVTIINGMCCFRFKFHDKI